LLYSIRLSRGGERFSISPSATFKFQAWSESNPSVAIIDKTSSEVDLVKSEITFTLSEEDTDIPAGTYKTQLAVFWESQVASFARANLIVTANPLGE
jgi:hypothetical protein